ncbi:MAG: glycosyltransferase family 4 protein [Patescibacteria group bacterium]
MRLSNQKKKISLLVPPRTGGPLGWAKNLVYQINKEQTFEAEIVTSPLRIFSSHFKSKGDIIHAAVPLACNFSKKPYILTVKGDFTIEKTIWRSLYFRAIKKADIITVPSQYLKDRIPCLEKAVVIPNAVNLDKFKQVNLNNNKDFNLLIVSNFCFEDKTRGVINLLKIFEHLNKGMTQPGFRVTVLGDGPYKNIAEKNAAGLSNSVDFVGWADPVEYFDKADIFTYYSYHDNMPNAVLEAMAAGLPVISNVVGALPEMIETGVSGILVQSDEEYKDQLKQLLINYDLRKRVGQGAREKIETKFNWEKVVKEYIAIYQKLI